MAFINMIQIQRVGLLAAIVVMVSFACPSFTYAAQVTLVVNSGNGDGLYNENQSVNITAAAAPAGKEFDKWVGDTFVLANPKQASTTATIALPPPGKMTVVQDFEHTGTNDQPGTIGQLLNKAYNPKPLGFTFRRWGVVTWRLQTAEGTGNVGSLVADNNQKPGNFKYRFPVDGFTNPFDGTQSEMILASKIIAVSAGSGDLGLRVAIALAPEEQLPPAFGIQSTLADNGQVRFMIRPDGEGEEYLSSSETLTLNQWYDLQLRITAQNNEWSQATGSIFFRQTNTTDWTPATNLQDILLSYDDEKNPVSGTVFRIRGSSNNLGHAQLDDLAFGTPLVATNPSLTITATYKDKGVVSTGDLIPPNQLTLFSFTDEVNAAGGRLIDPAFNGIGLGGDTHNTVAKSMWFSPGFAVDGKWIKVDLGGTFNLDHLRVWNFNSTSRENLGIKQADIYVALTDPKANQNGNKDTNTKLPFKPLGWTLAVNNQPFTKSPGGAIKPTDEHIDLGGVKAAYLAIRIDSNFTTDSIAPNASVGLSEMQVFSRNTSQTPHVLTVVNGNGGGGSHLEGAIVTILADAAPVNQKFDRWTGDGITFVDATLAGTGVIMPATAATVTATYKSSLLFTLTVNNGSGDGLYGVDDIVPIVAADAPAGQNFKQWTGDIAAITDPFQTNTTIIMPESNVAVTATYQLDNDVDTFLLTVINGSGGGSLRVENETIDIVADDAPEGQQFDQWTGDIASVTDPFAATTQITMPASAATITATYKSAGPRFTWDVDGDGNVKVSTDGLLNLRHQFGFTGAALINNIAIDSQATRKTAAEIAAYLTAAKGLVASDIDGNGEIDALTDGVLLMRYLDGSRNDSLITDAVGDFATRSTATDIQDFIQASMP